jgi:hypothetical protein
LRLFLASLQPQPQPASSTEPQLTLFWCLVGGKSNPEHVMAVVFGVRRAAAGGSAGSGGGVKPVSGVQSSFSLSSSSSSPSKSHQSGNNPTEYFVLPLVPERLLALVDGAGASAASTAAAVGTAEYHMCRPSRHERWLAFAAILAMRGVRKVVWDAKPALHAVMRLPPGVLEPAPGGAASPMVHATGAPSLPPLAVEGLWDPLLAAWMLYPDGFAKGELLPPSQHGGAKSGGVAGSASGSPAGALVTSTAANTASSDGISLASVAVANRVPAAAAAPRGASQHPVLSHLALLAATSDVLVGELQRTGQLASFEALEMPLVSVSVNFVMIGYRSRVILQVLAAIEVTGMGFAPQVLTAALEGVQRAMDDAQVSSSSIHHVSITSYECCS